MTRPRVANAMRLALIPMFAVLITVSAGCSEVVAGAVHAGPNLKPHPLTGAIIQNALLTDTELSHVFDQAFEIDNGGPPKFGGPEAMFWGWPGIGQSDCAGLIHILMGEVYANAQVINVAHEQWWDSHAEQKLPAVIELHEGVVALPTVAAADALFTKFSTQWTRCTGQSVNAGPGFRYDIGEVHAGESVLEATMADQDQDTRLRMSRALGVRDNCIVEVEITPYSETAPAAGHSAGDIARQMLDKISDRA